MRFLHIAAVAVALLGVGAAIAEDGYTEEYRILGPAQTYHSNNSTAQLKVYSVSGQCRIGTYLPDGVTPAQAAAGGLPSRQCPQVSLGNYQEFADCHLVEPYGAFACTRTVVESHRRYKSTDPALGVQYARRFDDRVVKTYVMVVRDSYGLGSVMVGGAYQWPLLRVGTVTLDGGIGAALWYRSVLNTSENELKRTVVPFVFPNLSFTEETTGLGIDVAAVPKVQVKVRGKHYAIPTTISAQLTLLVHKNARVSLEPGTDGVTMHYGLTF